MAISLNNQILSLIVKISFMVFVYLLLSLLLFIAAVIDIRQRRIPNWLSGLVAVMGLSANTFLPSGAGFYPSMIGLLAGFISMLILYFLTGLGAGDVKLMASVGSVVGIKSVLIIFYYSFLISAGFALGYLICKGGLADIFRRFGRFFLGLFKGRLDYSKPSVNTTAAFKLPMAPGIALATGYVLLPKIIVMTFWPDALFLK
jgi:prepilin peptidase CpaA